MRKTNRGNKDMAVAPSYLTMDQLNDLLVSAYSQSSPQQVCVEKSLVVSMANAMRSLGERPCKIMAMHFYQDMTYKEIEREIGLSRARVGQIIQTSLRRLRHPCRRKLLREHFEPE